MKDQSKYYFRNNSDLQYNHSQELEDYISKMKNKQTSNRIFNSDLIFQNHRDCDKFLLSVKKLKQNFKTSYQKNQSAIKISESASKKQPKKYLNKIQKKSINRHRNLSFSINRINKLKLQLQNSLKDNICINKKSKSQATNTISYNFPIKYQTKSNIKGKMKKKLIKANIPKSHQRLSIKQYSPQSIQSIKKIQLFIPKSIQMIPNKQIPFKNLQKYKQKQMNKKAKFFRCINNFSHYSTMDELIVDQYNQNFQKIFTNTQILNSNNLIKNKNSRSSVQKQPQQGSDKFIRTISSKYEKRFLTLPNNRHLV